MHGWVNLGEPMPRVGLLGGKFMLGVNSTHSIESRTRAPVVSPLQCDHGLESRPAERSIAAGPLIVCIAFT